MIIKFLKMVDTQLAKAKINNFIIKFCFLIKILVAFTKKNQNLLFSNELAKLFWTIFAYFCL